jgi:hypothetical protein|tara:strand:+ start:667 stop:912 length:246 start_codon:yes stop_codon:yes gene_type:complete
MAADAAYGMYQTVQTQLNLKSYLAADQVGHQAVTTILASAAKVATMAQKQLLDLQTDLQTLVALLFVQAELRHVVVAVDVT